MDGPAEIVAKPPLFKRRAFRLSVLAFFIVALWLTGYLTGLHEELTPERVRDLVTEAGALGIFLFMAIVVAAQLMQIPGLIFVAASIFAWGPWQGAAISSVAFTFAVALNLFLIQRVGGDLKDSKRKMVLAVLARIHRRPMTTMIIARVFCLTSPQLTLVLALSGVKAKDHALASFIGMTPIIFGAAVLFEMGFEKIGWM